MQRTRRAICSPRGQLTISLSGPAACMRRHSNSARPGSGLDHSSNKEDEMTSNVVETRLPRSNTSRLSNEAERPTAAADQFSRAKQLAESLLSERGEASSALLARELHHVLRALDADDRHGFQRYLATAFQPDKAALRAAAERYLADTTAEAAAALAQAADPPRQELLRRMNMAPDGTGTLIAMRSEITAHLRHEPELKLLDADLKHLFASWFNRGFLELRRIDWQSPAAVLEKLIAFVVAGCGGGHGAGAGGRRGHRDLLFDLQLSGRPARRLVRQLPDPAGGRGAADGLSAAQAVFDAVAGAGLPALARATACRGKQPRCRAAAEARARRLVARSRAKRTAARSLDAPLCGLPDATGIARKPHRPGSAFSPRQRRAARADQLARQHRAARHPGIVRHHGELPLRHRNDREQL